MSEKVQHYSILYNAVSTLQSVDGYLVSGMETAIDVAQDVNLNDEPKPDIIKEVGDMKQTMLKFIEMERELQQYLIAVDSVKKHAIVTKGELDFRDLFTTKMDELKAGNTEEDILEHEKYVKITSLHEQLEHKLQNSTSENLDEEIAITQQEENTRCAITGKEMTDPLRNSVCGHNYDRQGIEHYLKTRPKGKCPVSACLNNEPVQMCNLAENNELKRLIEKKNRFKAKRGKRPEKEPSILL